MKDFQSFLNTSLRDHFGMMHSLDDKCLETIEQASLLLLDTVKSGKIIFWCGNGGSAAQAQHLSTELVGGLRNHSRKGVASIALTTDSSFLTAWSNDTDFATVFSRQIEALGKDGDLLFAISTSGNSINVVNAVRKALEKQLKVIALTGEEGGTLKNFGTVTIQIPSRDTQRIQEGHLFVGHILCEFVERKIVEGELK